MGQMSQKGVTVSCYPYIIMNGSSDVATQNVRDYKVLSMFKATQGAALKFF